MEQLMNLSNIITIVAIILVLVYWLHTFVILYHLIRFGVGTRPKQVSLLFFAGSFVLFLLLMLPALSIAFLPQ